MSATQITADEVCARFSRLHWHDSKLLNLHLLKVPDERKYDLQLEIDLITGFEEGEFQRSDRTAVFRECRIVQMDLDLLGIVICGGDIGSATCYVDAVDLEKRYRAKLGQFDFPQSYNPLEECFAFLIEMIHPGGEMIIFAKDFQLI